MVDFYAHESCGQCTPCREGTTWLAKILRRIEDGQGSEEDLDALLELGKNMTRHHDLRAERFGRRAGGQLDRRSSATNTWHMIRDGVCPSRELDTAA